MNIYKIKWVSYGAFCLCTVVISLDPVTVEKARKIGEGNLSLGLRKAVNISYDNDPMRKYPFFDGYSWKLIDIPEG